MLFLALHGSQQSFDHWWDVGDVIPKMMINM